MTLKLSGVFKVSEYSAWVAAQVDIVSKSQNRELLSSDYNNIEFYDEKSEEYHILISSYLFEGC